MVARGYDISYCFSVSAANLRFVLCLSSLCIPLLREEAVAAWCGVSRNKSFSCM